MRWWIAGGTGYIGGALTRAALSGGHEVTVIARTPEAASKLAALDPRVNVEAGDLADPATLAAAGVRHDVIVHAASLSGPERAAVDRAATFALIESARRAGKPRTVIYTSGIWTLGPTGLEPAGEDAPTDAPAEVSVYRVALERDVIAAASDEVNTAVLRPGMVYGGQDGVFGWTSRWLPAEAGQPGSVVTVGDGTNRWPVVHLDDLARAYLAIGNRGANGMFHAVESEPVTPAAVAAWIAEETGRPRLAWPLAAARAKLGPIAHALVLDQRVIAPRTQQELGWRPTRALMKSLDDAWSELGDQRAPDAA